MLPIPIILVQTNVPNPDPIFLHVPPTPVLFKNNNNSSNNNTINRNPIINPSIVPTLTRGKKQVDYL